MATDLFAFDKFYQTQPPRTIEQGKASSVFEYLIFSGTPIHLTCLMPDGVPMRISETAQLVENDKDYLSLELQRVYPQMLAGGEIIVSFGYKRSRTTFRSQIRAIEGKILKLNTPDALVMTNLRRNPRLVVEKSLFKGGIRAELKAITSVGDQLIKNAELYEVSQFGASLFIDRNQGLLLPGDKIPSMIVYQAEFPLFSCEGEVSRVDMKRSSTNISQSYEVVVLFQKKKNKRTQQTERSAKRIPILDSKPCFFSAEHPFFPGRKIKGQVLELSSSGFSCILEGTAFPVIPGMRFPKCQLQLPFCPPRELCVEVVHADFRSDGETNQFKIGGGFVNGSMELLKDISEYTQQAQSEYIRDLTDEDLDLLWSFMFETNFIYQKKRKQIQYKSSEILETYKRLLQTENPIVKKIIFREDDEIKGHVSGVRFYDNTWLIQHLNALKAATGSAGKAMVEGMINFFYDRGATSRNSIRYTMSFFRPDNLYPALVFGESCRIMNDPQAAVCYDFCFGLPLEKDLPSTNSFDILADKPEALNSLLDHLIQAKMTSFLRATDLSNRDALKPNVCEKFSDLGLFRERHIVMASQGDNRAYALVEMASPGLNLSELTNCCYIFQNGYDRLSLKNLSEQVLAFAEKEYYGPKSISPVVLMPCGSEPASNVGWEKIYTCWILNADAVPKFGEVTQKIFGDFKNYVARWKERHSQTSNPLQTPVTAITALEQNVGKS